MLLIQCHVVAARRKSPPSVMQTVCQRWQADTLSAILSVITMPIEGLYGQQITFLTSFLVKQSLFATFFIPLCV
jgi:hypothetical protein